jgi:hypothetical protein
VLTSNEKLRRWSQPRKNQERSFQESVQPLRLRCNENNIRSGAAANLLNWDHEKIQALVAAL